MSAISLPLLRVELETARARVDAIQKEIARLEREEQGASATPRPAASEPAGNERLWTPEETAEYLQLSVSWVYDRAAAGDIPCLRINERNLRFEPEAIRAYARGAQPAKATVVAFDPVARKRGARRG